MSVNKIEDICAILGMIDGFALYEYGDLEEKIWWRRGKGYEPITFFISANDVFYWACSDCEELTGENLPELQKAIKDIQKVYGVETRESMKFPHDGTKEKCAEWTKKHTKHFDSGKWGSMLFCCRARKMRPQNCWYKDIPVELHDLFNACGPERTNAECG